jgi:hypothetical protein
MIAELELDPVMSRRRRLQAVQPAFVTSLAALGSPATTDHLFRQDPGLRIIDHRSWFARLRKILEEAY